MNCPKCNKELEVDSVVFTNADIYRQTNRIVANCCGYVINVTPIRTFEVEVSYDQTSEDDWGTTPKPVEERDV